MKTIRKTQGVLTLVIATIFICVSIMSYCIAVGENWTHPMMDDPLFYIQTGQIAGAIIIAVGLSLFRSTRKNGLWYIIPLILIVFSFLYEFILHLVYPCC